MNTTKELHQACATGNLKKVKEIVENGYDLSVARETNVFVIIGRDFTTPLKEAIKNKHYSIIEYLLENGANINEYFGNSLSTAIENDDNSMFKFLVKNNASLYINNISFLSMAACLGNLELVEFIMEHIDRKKFAHAVLSSFIDSAKFQQLHIIEYFLQQGMQLETLRMQGLHTVVKTIESRLLEKQLDSSLLDKSQTTIHKHKI